MESLTKTFEVMAENTAKQVGSGDLEVLATPIMSAWMENTAMLLAAKNLNEEDTTVGISIHVEHIKASAIGETIQCSVSQTATEGRKLSFDIICKDRSGATIGTAKHERFIVNRERFMQKVLG